MGSPWKGFVEFTLPASPPATFVSSDLSSSSPIGLSLSPYGPSVSSASPAPFSCVPSLPPPPLPLRHQTPIIHPALYPPSRPSDWPNLLHPPPLPTGSETSLCCSVVLGEVRLGLSPEMSVHFCNPSFDSC